MTTCPQCHAGELRRAPRTLAEKLSRHTAAYACSRCGHRQHARAVKHCWRCGTDLDRRRRQTLADRLAAAALLWPYSCRRCGTRRYRWGKHAS